METRVSLKHFVNDSFWKQFFACNSHQTPSNLINFFENFGNLIKLQKMLKSALVGNLFSDLFTEVYIWY